jgi:hypothetical protein
VLFRSPRFIEGRTAHTKCGTYLLASSLAAALLDELFEHPAERHKKSESLRKLLMGKTTQPGVHDYLLSRPWYFPCR